MTISAALKDMQQLITSKNWYLIKATLGLAIAFLLFGTPQTSCAIYAAIIAKQNINFNANGFFVDSYNGTYDPEAPGDDGNVVSVDGAIFIANGDIFGEVTTGPEGMVNVGSEGGIGTHFWLSYNLGVEPGYVSDAGPIFGFPTVTLPYTSGTAPAPGIFTTTSTNTMSATNSSTPPPPPGPLQTIDCSTNLYIDGTNTTIIQVTGTNEEVIFGSSNLVCGTQTYIGKLLPPNCCSFVAVGHAGEYEYTLIVGTNITYVTNVIYTYSTNYDYSFGTNYSYTIYTADPQTNYYDHIVCGNYCAGDLSGVTLVTCPSTLVLTNGLNLTGIDSITIMPGASLLLYVDGGAVTIWGGGIANLSGIATNLQIYCAPGVTSLVLDNTGSLSAVIVAPNTYITINGNGGVGPMNYFGNIMANSLTVNGDVHLHGDEAVKLPTEPVVDASVYPPPLLLVAQTNPIAAVGWQVSFGSGPIYSGMNLQWFFNGTNLIANATNSYLSLSNVTTDMTGEYTLQESAPGLLLVSQPAWLTVVSTPAATLDSFSLSASNQFQFVVDGLPGYRYLVEGSSNLMDWTLLESGPAPFTYTDPNQLGPQFFYRAAYVTGSP